MSKFKSDILTILHSVIKSGCKGYGSVLSARTAYGYNEVVLTLFDIIRYEKRNHILEFIKELLGFFESVNIVPYLFIEAGLCFEFLDIEGIGKESYVKYQVGICGNTVFKAE